MSAFVKFTNYEFSIWDNECTRKSPWFKSMDLKEQNIIINILGLSTRFHEPFKSETDFSFRDIFVGKSHWQEYSLLVNAKNNTFKSFNELKTLFDTFLGKFHKNHKTVVFHDQLNYVLNSVCNKNKNNRYDEALYSNNPVMCLTRYGLYVDYAPVIGGSELKTILLWFNSESEALSFREQLMMEVQDFYNNYASFVKEVIVKKELQ